MLKNIVIFGVGLIGGSFARALKQADASRQVTGFGRTEASLLRARELGVIDVIGTSLQQSLAQADLILLAVPVAQTEATLKSIEPYLQPATVVTDAGSIKGDVVAAARRALGVKINQFVPGHPIAGLETTGPEAAIANLYVDKKVVLTPLAENSEQGISIVEQAWRECGAIIHKLTPENHDAIFAAVSHLPHLLAYALVNDIAGKPHADLLFQYAASGFRDFTRIAGSSAEMWRDISLSNQAAIVTELDAYVAQLMRLRGKLVAMDGDALLALFTKARGARQNWLGNLESADAQRKRDKPE